MYGVITIRKKMTASCMICANVWLWLPLARHKTKCWTGPLRNDKLEKRSCVRASKMETFLPSLWGWTCKFAPAAEKPFFTFVFFHLDTELRFSSALLRQHACTSLRARPPPKPHVCALLWRCWTRESVSSCTPAGPARVPSVLGFSLSHNAVEPNLLFLFFFCTSVVVQTCTEERRMSYSQAAVCGHSPHTSLSMRTTRIDEQPRPFSRGLGFLLQSYAL